MRRGKVRVVTSVNRTEGVVMNRVKCLFPEYKDRVEDVFRFLWEELGKSVWKVARFLGLDYGPVWTVARQMGLYRSEPCLIPIQRGFR